MHGQQNIKKSVDFYSKNKFEKLVHLGGFIIRMYHDARSPERQIKKYIHFLKYVRYSRVLVHNLYLYCHVLEI